MYKSFFKRVIDIAVALLALTLFSPLLLVLIVLLGFANQGSVFFFQERPGKNGKVFRVIKFKSMNDKKDANGELLPDTVRLTPVGKKIRDWSLDELPQLINVLKGDMSLVGPRPLLVRYLPLYSDYHKQRHNVRPGITGLAQVSGRNALTWSQKFDLDVKYVESVSFMSDLRILFATVIKVVKREGVNQSKEVIAAPFTGYDD